MHNSFVLLQDFFRRLAYALGLSSDIVCKVRGLWVYLNMIQRLTLIATLKGTDWLPAKLILKSHVMSKVLLQI